jgi:hypothetical protein
MPSVRTGRISATMLGMIGLVACAGAPAPAPKPTPEAACASASEQYRAGLGAAAEECLSDEGCVAFGTCHAVTRGQVPALELLRSRAQAACQAMPGSHVDVECAPRPPRCVARRCIRF